MMMKPFDYRRGDPEAIRRVERETRGKPFEERVRALAAVMEEGDRIDLAKRLGQAPEACGSDAPHAAARGAMKAVETVTVRDDGKGGTVYETIGYRGRAAMRAEDALDRIKGLTEAQRAAGRRYAALVEAVEAGGMKCSGAFMQGGMGGGDDGRCFMDAYIEDCNTLRRMNRAIGDGIGMPVRRVRPSDRGTKASIHDRALADMVCIGGMSILGVLKGHGWTDTGRNAKAATCALAAVLERLRAC
ncbi:hypothetical protein [Mangrovicoccus sp. HB161399]|uniref:hypothetical protein n=1 Tax=Mangrovicoccus sp. HB161399 TaxID=2720392 RepID=UPI0015551166|nr:hypothetical protein [Mangrovicoccus sp. HB161399]